MEEESVMIQMTIAEDKKSFVLTLESSIEMTPEEIVMAIECWLRDNILEGYEFGDPTH